MANVLVLTGNDYLGREKLRGAFLDEIFKKHGEVTEEKFDSSAESFSSYIERAITPSLFQEIRIFEIRHAQNLKKDDLGLFKEVLSSKPDDVFFLIEFESEGRKKSGVVEGLDIKKLEKSDSSYYSFRKFDRPPDYQMVQWLTEQMPLLFNRKITKEGAEALTDLAGNELDKLYSELQKIDINLAEGAIIDKDTVEQIIGASREMSPFELARALGQKDFPRTLEIIESLFATSFYAPPVVSIIFQYFWKLMKIRIYAENNRDRANLYFKTTYKQKTEAAYNIGVESGVMNSSDSVNKAFPVMVKSGIIDDAVKYKLEYLKDIFYWLREYDTGIKTGRVPSNKESFQELCFKIVRVSEISERKAVVK